MSGAIPSNGTELSGDAKLVVEEVIKAAEKEGDGNAAAASVVAIAAAEEEEEKEELPDTLVEEVFYVTSDSSAPTYMIRPWDKERTQLSKWLWLLFGLGLWIFFVVYLIYTARYLASKPTSTEVNKEPRIPFPLPAIALCLRTLNSTLAREFVTPAAGGLQSIVQGNVTGMACFRGLTTSSEDLPDADGTCGSVTTKWIDYPFTVLPTVCRIFNDGSVTDGENVVQANTVGATFTIVGRFPDFSEADFLSFDLTNPYTPAIIPLLSNSISRGALYRVLYSMEESNLIKDCSDANGGQVACQTYHQQQCVEKLCNCKYPDADNPDLIPGSCEASFLAGNCPLKSPVFPCPNGTATGCTLLQSCDPTQQCPWPSCTTNAFPFTSSARVMPARFGGRDSFAISFILTTTDVEVFQQTIIYSGWQFFSGMMGLLSGLLGFSIVTCCEFWDNCYGLRAKKRAAAKEAKAAAGKAV